ncbi:MAG TPA: ABC transporter permease [Acholeplasmataceae bacterium]|nr:ABC transporter permease [Acholeplasmataceae bacterium]
MKSVKRILVFTNRNIKEIIRDPLSLIFLFLLPAFMLILFYLLFHKLTSQFQIKYLAPGMISFSHAFLALFISLVISGDKESAFITRLYTTPLRSYEFIIGYVLSIIPIGIIQTLIMLFLGGILEPSFFSLNMLICIPISLISILFFVSFGILFGTLFNQKSVGGITSILIMCQSMLSGMWYPLESMSGGFNTFINVLPFRSGSMLFQNIMIGFDTNVFDNIIKPLLIILAYTVAAWILAIIIYMHKMKEK